MPKDWLGVGTWDISCNAVINLDELSSKRGCCFLANSGGKDKGEGEGNGIKDVDKMNRDGLDLDITRRKARDNVHERVTISVPSDSALPLPYLDFNLHQFELKLCRFFSRIF